MRTKRNGLMILLSVVSTAGEKDIREFRNAFLIEFRNAPPPHPVGFLLTRVRAILPWTACSRKFRGIEAIAYCTLLVHQLHLHVRELHPLMTSMHFCNDAR